MENLEIFSVLSKQDKDVIGEFIFSCNNDILIIQDASSVLDLLESHSIILPLNIRVLTENQHPDAVGVILDVLNALFNAEQKKAIMDSYYGFTNC